jgi:hypothetical protein
VAAARSSNAGRPPSAEVRFHQEAFRQFAFQEGLKHLRNGRIDKVTIRDLLQSFKERHPEAPPSLQSIIARPQWLDVVRANDISRLVMSRTVPMVKIVDTIEEKLRYGIPVRLVP